MKFALSAEKISLILLVEQKENIAALLVNVEQWQIDTTKINQTAFLIMGTKDIGRRQL